MAGDVPILISRRRWSPWAPQWRSISRASGPLQHSLKPSAQWTLLGPSCPFWKRPATVWSSSVTLTGVGWRSVWPAWPLRRSAASCSSPHRSFAEGSRPGLREHFVDSSSCVACTSFLMRVLRPGAEPMARRIIGRPKGRSETRWFEWSMSPLRMSWPRCIVLSSCCGEQTILTCPLRLLSGPKH